MRILRTASGMQRLARRWQQEGVRVSLVPTMGYLHAGHLSLVRRARELVGSQGRVVVSIYVNPTQFGPTEDLSRYPRDLMRDLILCRGERVDVVFVPQDGEMYPAPFSTYVVEEALSRGMEGASRPTHFRGVLTVVAKLFHLVLPTFAVFGQKDFQQASVVRRMVRDLNFPLKIVVAPICREPDGLAMSSRNKYLEGDLRQRALVLWRAIGRARQAVRNAGGPVAASRLKQDLKRFIEREPMARLDYVEFFAPDTLEPAARVRSGVQMALAVHVGKTRLIDNARL